jgi:hypothetical protein
MDFICGNASSFRRPIIICQSYHCLLWMHPSYWNHPCVFSTLTKTFILPWQKKKRKIKQRWSTNPSIPKNKSEQWPLTSMTSHFQSLNIKKYDLYLGPAVSQLDKLLPIGPALKGFRTGVIHSRLLKYTHNHTACFTESNIGSRTS